MNIRPTRLAALSPTQESQYKKINNQNDLKEKELNIIYRQSLQSQNLNKPTTSYQTSTNSNNNNLLINSQQNNGSNPTSGLLTQSSQQKLFLQQPQSAQTIRNFSVKNANSQINLQNQARQLGQENMIIGMNNNQQSKNGKMVKSQSLQKNMRMKTQQQQSQAGSLKSFKHFQFNTKFNGENNNNNNNNNNENAENENNQEKGLHQSQQQQYQMGNNNANILNIQFNPSSTLNKLSSSQDHDFDMKKSFANIRLPKLPPPPPLSGKAREKNQKNQQKLNNFVDNHMGVNTENNNQDEEKINSKKNEKDPELERIKDRLKTYKNSKDLTNNIQDQLKSETPLSDSNQNNNNGGLSLSTIQQNQQTISNRIAENNNNNKKDEELSKIYGGNMKSLRSNTPKQIGTVMGLKSNYSTTSLQITPQTTSQTSATIQQSFGMAAFSSKLGPKKNSIQSMQQKQLKLFENKSNQQSSHLPGNHNSSSNSSQIKEENNEDKQNNNKNGPLYISHYAHRSKAGCNYQGPKRNQDNFIIHPNLNKLPNRYLFAVCDGHGVNGHDVSAFIKNTFPRILESLLAKDLYCLDEEYISSCLKLAFLQLSQRLLESKIDCTFSGSTFVAVLIIDEKIWCANTGDSRGILCKQTKALWNAEALSDDHKADDPEERKRIEASGGRVDSYRDYNGDPVGPARVWMKYDDIPGLAMSRSFGDLIAAQCGVICEPDIKYFNIEEDDRFIVIASDGVWEFMNNRQVMVHVMPYYIRQQPDMACQKLVKESTNHWKQHDEVVDDITAICVFLHKNKPIKPNKDTQLDTENNPFEAQTDKEEGLGQDVEENNNNDDKDQSNEQKIDTDINKIDEDLIEGNEDKSLGSQLSKQSQNKATQQNNKQSNGSTSNNNAATINMKQRKEQNLQKLIQNDNNKTSIKSQTTTTAAQSKDNKIEQSKSNNNQYNSKNEKNKKSEESSKNLIPDVDESDDSEYSKDFELDRQREQKDIKQNQQLSNKNKKNNNKSPYNSNNNNNSSDIPQYNFEEDDGDDDAFFKHL